MITWIDVGPRSLLFVPADKAGNLISKALASRADGIILDLEDAVAPAAKEEARRIGVAVTAGIAGTTPVLARVNAVGTEWFMADVMALAVAGVAGIALPKCEGPVDVHVLAELIGDAPIPLMPMIETARGVLAAEAIAGADPRVMGLAFGAEDLAAQMGVRRSIDGREFLHARSHIALAAVAAGRWALDSPCIEPRGVGATRREATIARALGYAGKLAIHPSQVAPVHEAFNPTSVEVELARKVLQAFEELTRHGSGVGSLSDRMIDKPVMIAAQRLMRRADAVQRKDA